jgi:signal transduction histidine kinase
VSIRKTHRASLLVALTAVLLVVLGILQYRWVGELSEFEYQRMQRTLRASADGLARDFEREFRRIRGAFELGRARDTEESLAREYAEWSESTDFPEMIAGVYWVAWESAGDGGDAAQASPVLQQLDFASGTLRSAEWPPVLQPIHHELVERSDNDRSRLRQQRSWTVQLTKESLALVIPQEDRRTPAWTVVLLDHDVMTRQFIPSGIERFFGPAGEQDYDVWILGDERPDRVIYASNPAVAADLSATDIRKDVDGMDWTIAAAHQTGSLEAFVGQYRRRNLSLGVGTVLVLGASCIVLVAATRRAQWLAERQMEFVAGVSHELRTPIAGISSLSQNLADGLVHEPAHVTQYGETINHESRRLQDMVEKVLHFCAVRSGQHRYNFRATDLPSLVERELESLSRHSTGPNPEFTVDGDLPPVVADEQALRSVVRNLVSNALKFGGARGAVKVQARRATGREGSEVELRVDDRGDGIDPSDIPHIFEPFYRGKAARAGQAGGSGLGLSLVREIVEAHRGRIEVSSNPGAGTTFRVFLPIDGSQEAHGSPA